MSSRATSTMSPVGMKSRSSTAVYLMTFSSSSGGSRRGLSDRPTGRSATAFLRASCNNVGDVRNTLSSSARSAAAKFLATLAVSAGPENVTPRTPRRWASCCSSAVSRSDANEPSTVKASAEPIRALLTRWQMCG